MTDLGEALQEHERLLQKLEIRDSYIRNVANENFETLETKNPPPFVRLASWGLQCLKVKAGLDNKLVTQGMFQLWCEGQAKRWGITV